MQKKWIVIMQRYIAPFLTGVALMAIETYLSIRWLSAIRYCLASFLAVAAAATVLMALLRDHRAAGTLLGIMCLLPLALLAVLFLADPRISPSESTVILIALNWMAVFLPCLLIQFLQRKTPF